MGQPSLLQIWSLDTSVASDFGVETAAGRKGKGMTFDMGITLDSEIMMLKWAPQGGRVRAATAGKGKAKANGALSGDANGTANGHMDGMDDNVSASPRLGIIAYVTSTGYVSILDVPNPRSAKSACQHPADATLFRR